MHARVLVNDMKLGLGMETHARILGNEVKARSHARVLVNEMTTRDLVKERDDDSVRLEHSVSLGNLSIENWSRARLRRHHRRARDAPPRRGTRTARW